MHDLLLSMQPILLHYGYWAIIVCILLEGMGIPLPGQSLLIAGSYFSSTGLLNLNLVLLIAWLSCFIGNGLGYLIGYSFEEWLEKKSFNQHKKFLQMQKLINQYGLLCLIISRFVEGMKQLMPIVCGLSKMPLGLFLLSNLIASTLWTVVFGGITFYFFTHLTQVISFYHHYRLALWCLGVIVLISLITVLYKKRSNPKH